MAALRDRGAAAGIKLFGSTIPLLDTAAGAITKLAHDVTNNDGIPCAPKKLLNVEAVHICSKNSEENGLQTDSIQGGKMRVGSEFVDVKTESDVSGQEKVLKKPDKILPCPRCNSMETKFCYFNNYNVNQPRHFCRNCQRYWTAGGTMRNVPVGSGRRRNKNASHYRNAMMSCDNIVAAPGPGDVPEVSLHQALPTVPPSLSVPGPIEENETLTKFGSEVPVFKSLSSVHNIGEQNIDVVSLSSSDNKEEKSCASSPAISGCSENRMSDSGAKEEPNNVSGYCNGVSLPQPHIQSYPAGSALVFPWSPGWNSLAVMAATKCSQEPIQGLENTEHSPSSWPPPSMMTDPGICAPVVPFPLMPPFWSFIHGWSNGMWAPTWPGNDGTIVSSTAPNNMTCSGNNSPALGKRSREANLEEEEKTERNLWIPKTLRIDDPAEAAKSSIWDTLGIKPDDKKGIFKSFQSNVIKIGETPETPHALKANPAAFSRAQSFQEGT